ncbi:iron ABC transporter ATP-binding protein, partial [Candidatus Poribacteria bacterium]
MRLVVRELSFSYGGRPALEGVSFESRDELLAVVGPNGSGKSTLLKCLCGILRGDGEIRLELEGRTFDLRRLGRREIARLIAYLPQDGEAGLPLTALEVVLLGRCPHRGFALRPKGDDIEEAMEALRLVGAEDLATRRFDELSGGERQKVRIARAVAQRPKLLLLDEPLNNLDLKHQVELISLLERLRAERKMCVVAVLH